MEFIVVFTSNDNPISVAGSSTLQIKFRKPSGTVVTKTAAFVTDSTTSITYTTVAGDLDEVGTFCLMGVADGFSSEVEEFEVDGTL